MVVVNPITSLKILLKGYASNCMYSTQTAVRCSDGAPLPTKPAPTLVRSDTVRFLGTPDIVEQYTIKSMTHQTTYSLHKLSNCTEMSTYVYLYASVSICTSNFIFKSAQSGVEKTAMVNCHAQHL